MELTPLELAALYAALANDGEVRDLRIVAAPASAPRRLFSPAAAWLTRRALAIRDRPDFPARREMGAAPRGIHWKTGTSFGNRDAWAVGSNLRYTVVVWTGNFDRTASPHLVGAETPAPVLFDLLEALDDRRSAARDLPPGDLTEVRVCALSGHLAGDACGATKVVLAPVASVPTDRCPFHQSIEVDAATGLRVSPACRSGREVRTETAVVWPVRVQRWLRSDLAAAPLPSWMPGCEPVARGDGPVIRSPEAGAVALLVPGMAPEAQEIGLEADAQDAELAWFVDGRLLAKAPPGERLWWPPSAGVHDIAVQDGAGRSSHVRIEVRAVD